MWMWMWIESAFCLSSSISRSPSLARSPHTHTHIGIKHINSDGGYQYHFIYLLCTIKFGTLYLASHTYFYVRYTIMCVCVCVPVLVRSHARTLTLASIGGFLRRSHSNRIIFIWISKWVHKINAKYSPQQCWRHIHIQ